jgi:hypothetical protein
VMQAPGRPVRCGPAFAVGVALTQAGLLRVIGPLVGRGIRDEAMGRDGYGRRSARVHRAGHDKSGGRRAAGKDAIRPYALRERHRRTPPSSPGRSPLRLQARSSTLLLRPADLLSSLSVPIAGAVHIRHRVRAVVVVRR